nr:hypothetical protein [Mesorhizobium sp.]
MTEQHAELLKVGISQLGQNVSVDRVLAKRLLVLLAPASQPSGNVHTSSPKAEFGPQPQY